ncbi:hypothetical protein Dda_8381 [Drechslerella dactyloides]|uniref:TMEM1 family protein n=1 Tax=Drechslerella dactyloides TaxID=74499 RepID=A0AAD6IRG1_DREDA|nr:hypothetical protein Dda_8381 [Drechslerella dactyloides]
MDMDGSTSKVTVTYWDPSSVYPLFSPDIKARLPLQNLHWKSPSRPLRSINSLYVEFIPAVQPHITAATATSSEDPATSHFTRALPSLYSSPSGLPRSSSKDRSASPSSSPARRATSSIGRRRSSTPNLNTFVRRTTLGEGPVKERRHQIPGLRQTPYLKIFFLRCDDNDYYRNTARKEIKEWIATHCTAASSNSSSNSSSSKHDNHDAFEWMIVHVVLPGTTAATQPRLNGQSNASLTSNASNPEPNKSRFQFKSSSTILEKLKNDFGSTSKKALPRIVQIRLSHPQPSPPPGAPAPTTPLPTPAEKEADYASLISHMKSLILTSFDLRVLQYEDDITARSNQQHLPGWNFCTFFVLKEGLAGAFESVGLTEDAWAIYQELTVAGEGIIVGEEADREGGKTFLGWSGEVVKTLVEEGRKWNIQQATRLARSGSQSSLATSGTTTQVDMADMNGDKDEFSDSSILSSTRKPYRELILSNNISVFDFISYCFARQAALLLRLAATMPRRPTSVGTHPATADATYSFYDPTTTVEEAAGAGAKPRDGEAGYLTEVMKKGIEFLRTGSAVLRAELYRGWESMQADLEQIKKSEAAEAAAANDGSHATAAATDETDTRQQVLQDKFDLTFPAAKAFIDNYIASFVVNGVMQLIDATDHKSVPHLDWKDLLLLEARSPPPTPSITQAFLTGGAPKVDSKDMPPDAIPQRSTTIYSTEVDEKKGPAVSEGLTATEELAFFRAEALMLARGVVVEVAGNRWRNSKEKLHPTPKQQEASAPDIENMTDVNLNDTDSLASTLRSEDPADKDDWIWLWGIRAGMLQHALLSETGFLAVYERMTETAVKLFSLAKRIKSTERTLAEIACIKYYRKDYAAAAHYFSKLAPSYTMQRWTVVEENLLMMYADCLKKMGRDEEFGKVSLILLRKRAESEKRRWRTQRTSMLFLNGVIRIDGDEGLGLLPGMDEVSRFVSATDLRFDEFWTDLDVEPCPQFEGEGEEGKGGFRWSVAVKCRWLLNQSMTAKNAVLSISIADEKVKGIAGVAKDIKLQAEGDIVVKRGANRIVFVADTFYAGTYEILSMALTVNNLTFKHKFKPDPPPPAAEGAPPHPLKKIADVPKIILFQAPDTFHIALSASKLIQLDKMRTVQVELSTDNTIVERVEMKVKSLTAGLRLLLSEIQVVNQHDDSAPVDDVALSFGEHGLIKLASTASEKRLGNVVLRIPYKSDGDLTDLSVRLEAHLATDTSQYTYVATPSVPVSLPLSVNVQDIFTRAALFSKFQVSTVNHIPLRIVRTELEGSQAFKTSTGVGCCDLDDGIVVYGKQPAGFTFKTTRISGKEEFSGENLYLRVMWRGVGDEILHAVTGAFSSHLSSAGLGRYQRLLTPTLTEIVRGFSKQDIERAALLGAVKLPSFAAELWTGAFAGVNCRTGAREVVTKSVEEFFGKWSGRKRVPLLSAPWSADATELESRLDSLTRTIVIPVEIPALQCLATARLQLMGVPGRGSGGPKMVRVGEVIKTVLKIGISRCWDLGNDRDRRSANVPAILRFYYEMSTGGSISESSSSKREGRQEDWLVNGRRRGVFEFSFEKEWQEEEEEKEVEFELLLVPLKSGFLLLPGIEVRALPYVPTATAAGGGGGGEEEDESFTVTCETDYRSASEGVLVVSEVEEKVVKVDEVGTMGRLGGAGSMRRPISSGGEGHVVPG